MKYNAVNCKEVMKHVCDTLGEDLNSEKCIAIKDHLDNCSGCSNYFKSVEMTIDFYKKYNVEIPQSAHDRLMDVLGINENK
jgi:predicted anti-sigma-YlaC factor YlaD